MSVERQRIDKWLWHARVARTRSAAAALAAAGHVRVNGLRIDAPSRNVKPGDIVTIALDSRIRVLKVVNFAMRRGPAEAARALYEEQDLSGSHTQAGAHPAPNGSPAPGGRPTKRDRRTLRRLARGEQP